MKISSDIEKFLIQSEIDEILSETPDDWASIVLPHLNYEYHLSAINNLLSIHKIEDKKATQDINEISKFIKTAKGARKDYIQYLIGEQMLKFHCSAYQSAAYSMAAVGMLAPFLESIFHQSFFGIKDNFFSKNNHPNTHSRWEKDILETWDCHFVWDKNHRGKDLVRGIIQLSDATGLRAFLPQDITILLTVLFSYRNKMFHCGFEWPIEERNRFWNRIKEENWPVSWLEAATSGGEPWLIYLSDDFISHCVESIEEIINGISRYVYKISGLEERKKSVLQEHGLSV